MHSSPALSQPVPTRTPEVLTAEQAEAALKALMRELRTAGKVSGCRMLSGVCDCPLCLIETIADRNQPETINLRREVETLRTALAQRTEDADEQRTLHQQALKRIDAWHAKFDAEYARAEKAEAELAQAREQRDAVLAFCALTLTQTSNSSFHATLQTIIELAGRGSAPQGEM